MQVAQERVHLLTSAEDIRKHAVDCAHSLHLQGGAVKKGLISMVAASGFAMMVNAMRRKDAEQGVQLSRTVGLGRYISTKLALGLVIPVLHKVMVGSPSSESSTQPTQKKRGLLRRLFSSKTR